MAQRRITFLPGFIFLFFIYHFPEFFPSFALNAIFKIGFLIAAIALGYLQGWKGLAGYGLSFIKTWYKELLTGLLVGCLAFAFSIFLSIQLNTEKLISAYPANEFLKKLPFALIITFFPSIAEDILTRGYLFAHVKNLQPAHWILLSSAIYVLNHIWRFNDGLAVLSYLFLLGLVLATCVMAKKSLWLAFGIHWGSNIAFTLSGDILNLQTTGNPHHSTWLLAFTWGIVFLILLYFFKKINRAPINQKTDSTK